MTEPLPLVLVVDDKPNMVTLLAKVLRNDARVIKATSGAAAIQLLAEQPIEVVVCDLRMPDIDGLAVLDATRRHRPSARFVLMTAYGSVPNAIDAMKRGAFDYVTKPFEPEQLRQIVLRALGTATPVIPDPPSFEPLPGVIGTSLAMGELTRLVRRVAASDMPVLVSGETGTGKELVARALHAVSGRATAPLVVVRCVGTAADELLAPAITEQARGGALLLDEVGELRLAQQARLLRWLEEARLGASVPRLLSTTHRDLDALAREGSFREDLVYRIRVASIRIPPLRERSGDVALLAQHFLAAPDLTRGSAPPSLAPEALVALERYRWPGNVRELRASLVDALIASGGARIELQHLPPSIRTESSDGPIDFASMSYQQALDAAREDATRRYLEAVLARTQGRVAAAAEIAGIERESFYRLLRRYGVSPDDYRGG